MIFTKADYTKAEVNKEIFNLVPPRSNVLDIGCGKGLLLDKLATEKNCTCSGIDIEYASHPNFTFYLCDANHIPPIEDIFDCIIFGDILEHLEHPDKTLLWATDYLDEDGYLIISFPNVANWKIRFKLLFGMFDYDGGLLDWGHLRFFTLGSMKELLRQCGYKVTYVGTRNRKIRLLGQLWKGMFAFQFIIKARKL